MCCCSLYFNKCSGIPFLIFLNLFTRLEKKKFTWDTSRYVTPISSLPSYCFQNIFLHIQKYSTLLLKTTEYSQPSSDSIWHYLPVTSGSFDLKTRKEKRRLAASWRVWATFSKHISEQEKYSEAAEQETILWLYARGA